MSICGGCFQPFNPDDYLSFCNLCGAELTRQLEAMQEYQGEVLGLEVVASRVMFGERPRPLPQWKVG